MGGCISNHASSKETSKLVLQILAEVYTIPATSETSQHQQWRRLFHSLVPVSLACTQREGDVFVYTASASGVDGSSFTAHITVPGTELHKTSPCFIQWSEGGAGGEGEEGGDDVGVMWGLNFMSEVDAMRFLKGCTPPTLTPESKKKRLSLPITPHHITPPPPPPSQDTDHRLSDSFESLESDTHSIHAEFDSNNPIPDNQHGFETTGNTQTEPKNTDFNTAMHPYTHVPILPDTQSGIENEHNSTSLESQPLTTPTSYSCHDNQITEFSQWGDDGGNDYEGERRSELFDVEGDSEGGSQTEGRIPALFEPTSSLHLMPTGILHDIAEETETDTECEHSWNSGGPLAAGNGLISEGIEFAETGFFDNIGDGETSSQPTETPPTPGVAPPPSLPVSPPPGPVLSPRLSMLLAEAAAASTPPHNCRLSVASVSSECPPPPLPSSLPPGKLISPRHSLMEPEHSGRPDSILGGMRTELDFALLSQKSSKGISDTDMGDGMKAGSHDLVPEKVVRNEGKSPQWDGDLEIEANEEPLQITTIDEVDDPTDDLCDASSELLPPPPEAPLLPPPESPLPPPAESADEESPTHNRPGSKLKITPSFLRSLEPPREFSDSGFPDTDHEHAHSTTPEQVGDKNGSTAASDERNTEHSGSVIKNQSNSVSTGEGGRYERSSTSSSLAELERDDKEGVKIPGATATHTTTRKAGWLELKTMLVRKNRKVAMKSKRRWRRFWASLKSCSLLFSVCEDGSSVVPDDMPVDTRLDLGMSLAHAVHDHVKRDFIFCLSTANGNTYYLQTTSVAEMEDWIASIHSAAAVAMTRNNNKEKSIQMIKEKIEELNTTIEKETQLRNMTELNRTTVSDYNARSMATKQLVTCTEDIERYNVEIYRLRCYMASLQGQELPNPQTLLASISKPTKLALGKVGVFSVASLHAIVSARSIPSSTSSYGSFRFGRPTKLTFPSSGRIKRLKHKTFPRSEEKNASKSSLRKLEISGPYPMLQSSTLHSMGYSYSEMEETTDTEAAPFSPNSPALNQVLKVVTPGNRLVPVTLHEDVTIEDVLHTCCRQQQVDVRDHFVRLRMERQDGEFECEIPSLQDKLQDQDYTHVELCQKWSHTVILSQPDLLNSANTAFGLTLEPTWDVGGKRLEMVVVSKVEEGGVADRSGVWEGDEVMRVNGRAVKEAGWVGTRSSLDAPSVSLTLKTCHIEMPVSEVTNQIVESLICPAPPSSHLELTPDAVRQLTVPTPTRENAAELRSRRYSGTFSREQIDILLKDSHDLSKLLKSWDVQRVREEPAAVWTQEDRLRKSAQDLVDTERDYVRLLHLLVEWYLEPLQSETFLSSEDRETLEGNTLELLEFQTLFLQGLEEALALEMVPAEFSNGVNTLKNMVFAIAGTFLVHMESFRMYSTFCASHHKIKQLLQSGECTDELHKFLEARNPRHDHTLTLPALFAKPIVRLSRYPLFLNAMIDNTPANSEERSHLTDVVEGMTCVANYINEMQRVSETYSSLFSLILLENASMAQSGLSLSVTRLCYHGEVMWLNPTEEHRAGNRTSWKKGQGPQITCFVFASAIVLVCVDRRSKRRVTNKALEVEVGADDTRFRILLPSLHCSVHDLPDSDGVTNMWQLKYNPSPPANSSPSLSSPSHTHISYLLRSQSMEQKAAMVHLARQSITDPSGGDGSPLPHSSPHHSPSPAHTLIHTSSPSHSPLSHKHTPLSPLHHSHSSPRHRPRSNSQPHLPYYTPPLHSSQLSYSQLPSLPSLNTDTSNQ